STTPKIHEIYTNYKTQGLEVYAVSLDNNYAVWLQALQEMKLDCINVSELNGQDAAAVEIYALARTPTIFLIDKAGKILENNIPASELETILKKYLPSNK